MKNKKLKKILALLLSAVLLVAFLAACVGDDPEPPAPPAPPVEDPPEPPPVDDPVDETPADTPGDLLADSLGLPRWQHSADPIVFDVWIGDPGLAPAADNPIHQIVEDITGVRINHLYLVGDFETAFGVMLAAGGDALPHGLILGDRAGPAIDSGHVIPIGDLIEAHAPNLRAHYEPWWPIMTHPADGLIYTAEIWGTSVGLDQAQIMGYNGTAFYLQKAVVDFHGRAPSNLNEYFEFMYEYMQANPEIDGVPTRGFEIMTEGWRRFAIDNPPMFLAGHANWGGQAINAAGADPDALPTPACRWTNDWNKEYYEILNYWFHRGLIHADTLALSHDEYLANIASGTVLGMSDQHWSFGEGENPLRSEGRFDRTYIALDFANPGVTPNYIDTRVFAGSNGINITTSNPDPIRFIQFMDWIIQEPVQKLLAWGIEGEHWYYDENGTMVRPEEQRINALDPQWNEDNMGIILYNWMPKMQGSFSDGNATTPGESPAENFAGLSDWEKEFFGRYGIYHRNGFMTSVPSNRPVYYPYWGMSWPDGGPVALTLGEVNEVNVTWLSRLVIAPEGQFDSLWEQYQAELLAIDQSPVFDWIIEEGNRQLAALGLPTG